MRIPLRFRDTVLDEVLAVASFVGSSAVALVLMASSLTRAGLRSIFRDRRHAAPGYPPRV